MKIWVTRGREDRIINLRIYFLAKREKKKKNLLTGVMKQLSSSL